jgi:TolB-like protein/Tfp pilus assembly protein PilF
LGLSSQLIGRELEKIVSSRTFRPAAAQRDFLRYAVSEELEGRGHLLKEYSIGIAVFRKGESFDPRLDSIVRTEARKLRARLVRYFETEGKADPIRIHFPIGKYTPVFREVSHADLTPADRSYRQAIRLVVLPFVSHGPDKRDEFFSDGLTDELTHAFARIEGLEVVPRTSAFQFKGQFIDVRDIGRRLHVHAVIEGSVRTSPHRLRVITQLADALNGRTVWSASYDRRRADLFALQQELSTTITGELETHFRRASLRASKSGSDDKLLLSPKVYEEYLKGQYFSNRYTIEDYEAAIDCFQQAIADESSYARAFTALSYCYVMLPFFKATLAAEFIPKIQASASRALEIDPSIGEAYIARAIPKIYDFDWSGAGEEFRKGLELSPSDLVGQSWYATYLLNIGREEEGLLAHKKVFEADPASPLAAHNYALALYFAHRYDEAIDQYRKVLTLNPSHAPVHAGLGVSCIRKGSYTRGITELKLAERYTRGLGRVSATLAYGYAMAGNRDKATEILNRLLDQFDPVSFPALMIAEIYIGLGERDRAFEWVHRAIDQKDLSVFLRSDPLYDPLRKDPRFTALLKRTNLL